MRSVASIIRVTTERDPLENCLEGEAPAEPSPCENTRDCVDISGRGRYNTVSVVSTLARGTR
ncbi:MAG: hypothetical protein NZ741_11700 [Armatimonadetes bacterium]|nr:hypothetical protein [Armatimonadota bacterium]